MTTEELIAEAKSWIRMTTSSLDEEIEQTLDACLLDLDNAGVINRDPEDALIKQAMKLYVKAQFGYEDRAEEFEQRYEFLKKSLSLSSTYNTEEEEEDSEGAGS